MKRVWIVAIASGMAVAQTAWAWPSCQWNSGPQPAGYAVASSSYYYGGGYYGGGGPGPYGIYRPYLNPALYGSYPYRPLHYSGLYPDYGVGDYYRTWPYYPSYSGAYPSSYSYAYRYNPYTVFSTAIVQGPELLKLYEFPERAEDLEDVDKTWAWGYMAEGNFNRASAIFAAMERQTPGTGWPKIGTGLMAGFSGDYRKAVYQFRRAFRFDPSNPGRLPEQREFQEKLGKMLTHFKRESNSGRKPDADAEFMVAALAYLSGDDIGAQNAIEKAMLHGDDSRSARNLKQLIDDSLDRSHDELLAAERRE